MKKLLLLLLLGFGFIGVNAQCNYDLELWDSWGDGWNGGTMEVLVNGISQGTYTLPTGFANDTFPISVVSNDVITFTYTAGSFASENAWQLRDENGTIVHTEGGSWNTGPSANGTAPAAGSGASYTVTASVACAPPACSTPTGLNASNMTVNSADLNWTAAIGTPVDYMWEVQPSGTVQGTAGALASGSGVVGTTVNTGGVLTQGVPYDFFVRTNCGAPDTSVWTMASTFTIPLTGSVCSFSEVVTALPYMDAGMTTAGLGDNYNSTTCNNYMTGDEKIYTYTPATTGNVDVKLENLTNSWTGISILDQCPDQAAAICLGDATTMGTTNLSVLNVSLTAGFTYYFIVSTNAAPQTTGGDFSITASPTCSTPVNLSTFGVGTTNASLTWDNGFAGGATQWFVEYDTTGFPQGTGTTMTVMTSDTLALAGLMTYTYYDWYVRSYCSPGDTSAWTGPITFATLNLPPATATGVACVTALANPTIVFAESFEDNSQGWTGSINAGNSSWEIPDGATSTNTGANDGYLGGNFMNFESSNTSTNQGSIVSPAIDLTAALDAAELSFYMHAFGLSMGTLNIGVGTSAAGPFTNEFTFTGPLQTSGADAWVNVGVDLTAYIGSTIYLEFTQIDDNNAALGASGFDGDMSIDSVQVQVCATCIAPTAGVASAITTSSAHLAWDGTGSAFGVWAVEFGPTGFTQGTGTFMIAPSPLGIGAGNDTALVSGLMSATTYDAYISNVCTPGVDTSSAILVSFTTLADFCGGDHFYDNGGSAADYLVTPTPGDMTTIFPDMPGDVVTATFNSFNTESGWDGLMIYDGPTTADPLISSGSTFNRLTCPNGAWTGTGAFAPSGPFTSTHATGALTFVFTADGGVRAGWDATITCALPPTCFQATALMVNAFTATSADVSWTPGATGTAHFIIEYDTAGFVPGTGQTMVVTTDTFATIMGLNADTQYEWYVTDSCGVGDTGPQSASSNFYTGYCIPVYGTTASSGCMDGDVIARVRLNTLDNNSGTGCPSGTAGYSDYSSNGALTTTLSAGTSYEITVWTGQWSEGYKVWIDYNNDLMFDASEVVGNTTSAVPGSGAVGVLGDSANFTISLDCNPLPGSYRMRVRCIFNNAGPSIDPCAFQSIWGETEDYTITIAAPPPCPQISSLATFGTITATTADFNWVTGCAEMAWDYEVTTSMTPPMTPANTMHADTFVNATGLMPSTTYYAHVRANCTMGSTSTWSMITFTTPALPPVNDTCGTATNLTVYAVGMGIGNELVQSTTSANPSAMALTTCDGFGTNLDLFYTFTMPAGETAVLVQTGGTAGNNIEASVYTACGGTSLYCETQLGNNGTHTITGLTGGTTYTLQLWHDDFNAGDFDVYLELLPPPPVNDSINGAIVMTCGSTETAVTTFATSDAGQGTCASTGGSGTGGTPGLGVWYSFIGTGEEVQVTLCGSDFDTELHIYSGPNADTCVISNDDNNALCGAGNKSAATFISVLGVQYYFLGGGFASNTGNLEISVTCIPVGVITWLGGSSNYNAGTNWSGGVVPTCADDVFIPLTANNPTITGVFECGDFGTSASVTPLVSLAGSLGICGNVSLANGTQISGSGVMKLIGTNTAGAGTFDVAGTASVERLSVESNYAVTGNLDVNNALEMNGGNLNAMAATVSLKATATTTAYLDDFTGAGGTYMGNITSEQYVASGPGNDIHYISSPVNNAMMMELNDDVNFYGAGLTGTDGVAVTVDDCAAPTLMWNSNYGNVFEMDESLVAGCELDAWVVRSAGTMTNGQGYSAYLNTGTTYDISGAPTTGNVTNGPLSNTASGIAVAEGWHLVGNPYPSPMNVDAVTNSTLTSPQRWVTSGSYNGTYQPFTAGQTVAIGQGIIAHSAGGVTFSTTNADRVASNNATWYQTASWYESKLEVEVNGNGFADKTVLFYSENNTSVFDTKGDCVKRDSRNGQPTIYTSMNTEQMSLNGYPLTSIGNSVPMGIKPGTTGEFVLSFTGLGTFDEGVSIYLEDKVANVFHSLADGDYNYKAVAGSNPDRFEIHFVLPIEIATTNVDCQGNLGHIALTSTNGITDRDFVLTQGSTVISSDDLVNLNNDLTAGNYLLTVNDAFGGNQVYDVTITQAESLVAQLTVSSLDVQVGDVVSFNNLTNNATDVEWVIADITTINGVNNATYSFDEVGSYEVTLNVANDECNASEVVIINVTNKTTSIVKVKGDQAIKVYTVGTELVLEFINSNNTNAAIVVENVMGQKVYKGTVITEGTQKIALDNVTTGYYFVTMDIEGQTVSTKIILTNE